MKFTAAQERRLVEFGEEWRQHGLCCEPADFATGDKIIAGFYSRFGKRAPVILHLSSPLMCELAVSVFSGVLDDRPCRIDGQPYGELGRRVNARFLDQLESQLSGQIHNQIPARLTKRLRGQPDSQLDDKLRSQLGAWLGGRLPGRRGRLFHDDQPRIGPQILKELVKPLHNRIKSQINRQLGGELGRKLCRKIEAHFDEINNQLRHQIGDQLHIRLYNQLGKPNGYFFKHSWRTQHWCAWEAFGLFCHEIGVRYDADDLVLLQEWSRLSQSVGWWAAWDNICVVSDRPRSVKFDDQRRLHCATGKAVEYSDGWGVSSWHGVQIPDEWLTNKNSLSPQFALKWGNVEQRRAACEILGWDNILSQLAAKIIDADPDPEIGTLLRVDLPGAPQEQFLRVQCGTGRLFAIPVPPDMKTAIQAQAWLWNLDLKDFVKPEIRT